MTVAQGKGPEVLRYDSPEYKRHEDVIDDIRDRLPEVGWMRREFNNQIFGRDGVICDRPRGDEQASVARQYFGRALNVTKSSVAIPEEKWSPELKAQRAVVMDTLAVHLSVMHEKTYPPQKKSDPIPFEAYRGLIEGLDKHCRDHSIPSPLPNLFLASSLYSQLRKEPAYQEQTPEVFEMYDQLSMLCSGSPKHLHAVITAMSHAEHNEEALHLLAQAADFAGLTSDDLCMMNPLLVETYVILLHKTGKTQQVADCGKTHRDKLKQYPFFAERVLLALLETGDNQTALDIVKHSHDFLTLSERPVQDAVYKVCVDLGWILYGEGRYQDAVDMIDGSMAYMMWGKGADDLKAVYRQNLAELNDDAKLQAFDAKVGATS